MSVNEHFPPPPSTIFIIFTPLHHQPKPVSVSTRHTGQPESYYHGEGRVALTDSVPRFQYKLTDHLGNTMVLFEDKDGDGIITTESMSTDPAAVEVLQRNFYYAFGLPMQGPWNHTPTDPAMPYLYNGKELEGELGLGWYAYGFRYYDASVGRFVGVDPLAEVAPDWTPYRYGFNNPITYIDPDGLFEDEAAARKYAKEEGIKIRPKSFIGKLFTSGSRHNLVENSDGTFSLEHGRESIQDLGGDFGVQKGFIIKPGDVIDVRTEVDEGGLVNNERATIIRRDGSEEEGGPTVIGGQGPVGPARYRKILSALRTFDKHKSVFRNDKGKLPRRTESGESIKYEKVDIDRAPSTTQHGARRSGRRLVKGSDGSYYYTRDHYETFTKIKVPQQ